MGFAPNERRLSQTVEYTANQIMREIPPHSNISLVSFGDDDSLSPHTCRHWQIGHPYARRCFVRGGTCDECLRSRVRVIPNCLSQIKGRALNTKIGTLRQDLSIRCAIMFNMHPRPDKMHLQPNLKNTN